MICKKCGSKNQGNIKYCTTCGTKLEKTYSVREKEPISLKKDPTVNKEIPRTYKKTVKNKKWYESKYTLIALIVIIIIFAGVIYGLLKVKNTTPTPEPEPPGPSAPYSSVEVDSVSVRELYGGNETSIDDNTIKTSVDSTIEVNPEVLVDEEPVNIDDEELNYTVEDASLVNFKVNNGVFTGMVNKVGITKIHISYNNEIIKTLTLVIKEKEESEPDVTQKELEDKISELEYAYQRALDTGDVSYVYPYVTKDGIACKAYKKYIPEWYAEGKSDYIIESSIQYGAMRIIENGTNGREYIVPRTATSQISEGGKSYKESGYIEFVLVYENGELYVDRLENAKSNVSN